MSRFYQLHGVCVRTTANHPAVKEMLHRALRYKGAEALSTPGTADLVLSFSVDREPASVPDDARHLGQSEHGHIDVWMTADRMMLNHTEASVIIDQHAGTATATITPDLMDARVHKRRDPLFYLITFSLVILLRYRGWFALHTAALARDDHGLLLVAQSDSGKSTATMNLVRQGWSYLSDDTVLLRETGDRVEAHSFRRNFCVDPEATALFPELADQDWPASLSDADKWQVDIDALYPNQYAPIATPRVLILPEIVDAPVSRVEPVDAKETLATLIDQGALFLTPDPSVARQHLEVFRRLIEQTHAYRLHAGRDLLASSDRIHALLAPLLETHDPAE